jgi:hypothetical protein
MRSHSAARITADTAAPHHAPASQWSWRVAAALCAALGALSLVPMRASLPAGDLDGSWGAVLHEAARQAWQFGPTITFTYGPLGYLAVPAFAPEFFWWTVACRIAIGAVCGWAFCSVGREAGWPPWLAVTALLVLWPPATSSFDIPWLMPVMLWPFVATADGKRTTSALLWLLSVLVGLTALVKFTTLVLATTMAAVVGADDVVRKRRWPVATLVYGATVIALWIASGQAIANVPSWLTSSWQTASGYNEAMSTPVGPYQVRELVVFGVNALALLAVAVWFAVKDAVSATRRVTAVFAVVLLLFVQFKLGFVRHDAHATAPMFAMPLLGVLTAARGFGQGARPAFRAAAIGLLVLGLTTYAYGLRRHFDRLAPPEHYRAYYAFRLEAVADLLRPWSLHARLSENRQAALARLRAELPMPAMAGTIDLYGHHQGLLLAHPVTYAPRPIFQSYGTYAPGLAALNDRHLRSPNAPRHVLVDIETIDHRYPLMDESASLLSLLSAYDVRQVIGPFAHLERREASRQLSWQPVATLAGRLGDQVEFDVSQDGPTWTQIVVQRSWLGSLTALAYKLPPIVADVTTADGRVREHRLLRSIGQAGMLLSPLVTSTSDFVQLANGLPPEPRQRVRALRIRVDWESAYLPEVTVRTFRLAGALGPPPQTDAR